MMSHGVSLCLMMSHGVSWYLMVSHGVSLCLMMSHDVMCSLMLNCNESRIYQIIIWMIVVSLNCLLALKVCINIL